MPSAATPTLSKAVHLETALRRRITRGEWAAGTRLPTRSELGQHYRVGQATVQSALNSLARDGFVVARQTAGTFVASTPPHLHGVALVLPAERTPFMAALLRATALPLLGVDAAAWRQYPWPEAGGTAGAPLQADITRHRVAGALYVPPPGELSQPPALPPHGLPRLMLRAEPVLRWPTLCRQATSFRARAAAYLLQRGRQRIAHLYLDTPVMDAEALAAAMGELGAATRPYWYQSLPPAADLRAASGVVNLLMHLEGKRRPDALVIHDEGLVAYALGGLLQAGVRVPHELEVVARTDFPAAAPTALPIRRLGWDCRDLLRRSLQALAQQRQEHRHPASVTHVPAVFEDELGAR